MLCYCKLLLILSKTSWTWVCFVYSYITCSLSDLKLINIGIHESIAIDIHGKWYKHMYIIEITVYDVCFPPAR